MINETKCLLDCIPVVYGFMSVETPHLSTYYAPDVRDTCICPPHVTSYETSSRDVPDYEREESGCIPSWHELKEAFPSFLGADSTDKMERLKTDSRFPILEKLKKYQLRHVAGARFRRKLL